MLFGNDCNKVFGSSLKYQNDFKLVWVSVCAVILSFGERCEFNDRRAPACLQAKCSDFAVRCHLYLFFYYILVCNTCTLYG